MVIRALICEDEPLARQTLRDFAAELDWLALIGEAADGRTALQLIDALRPDLVFLDMQMPELSGIEILRRAKHQPAIIFTTAFEQYAVAAFEYEAFDYLLKPFGRARFTAAAERARRRLADAVTQAPPFAATRATPLSRLFVRAGNVVIPLKIDEIAHFEADDDYVKVFTDKRCYLVSQTLGELETRLDASRFCRVHRSHIVNLEFIEKAETHDRRLLLKMKDRTEILASRAGSQLIRKLII